MSDTRQEPAFRLEGERLKALYVHLKHHEDELDRQNFATLNQLERVLFQHMSIEEVEQLIEERSSQRDNT